MPAPSSRRWYAIPGFALLLIVAGCSGPSGPTIISSFGSSSTSIQLQAIQAEEFETTKEVAFAATLSVFQDLGYIIDSAELATGFVTASSPTNQHWVIFVGNRMTEVKATAFVESIAPRRTRVRLNFVEEERDSGKYGTFREQSRSIEDPRAYQDAFTRIRKAVFVRMTVR